MSRSLRSAFVAAFAAALLIGTGSASATEILLDGGFETGIPNANWGETSTNFGTPLCEVPTCGTGGGSSPPRTGDFWAWFGGIPAVETATLSQAVVIPAGTATLSFYLRIGTVSTPFTDVLNVRVDGAIQQAFAEPTVAEGAYTLRSINLNAFANGASHTILFEYIGPTVNTGSFVVDDISLDSVADLDGDTVPDGSDNCPAVPNTSQTNSDGAPDGGDACDPDDDNDTVLDGPDQCPVGAAAGLDTDGDGCKDAGEDSDDDNDTVADGTDNCPLASNTSQTNTDGAPDGGNACDSDDDNDTVADGTDQCPTQVGPAPSGCPDGDADGKPDTSDTCPSAPGTPANGCPNVSRTLTLKYNASREKFKVTLTPAGGCAVSQKVEVFRKKAGPDQKIGEATTNANGKFKLAKDAAPGKYYARSGASTIATTGNCLAARSKKLKVE